MVIHHIKKLNILFYVAIRWGRKYPFFTENRKKHKAGTLSKSYKMTKKTIWILKSKK